MAAADLPRHRGHLAAQVFYLLSPVERALDPGSSLPSQQHLLNHLFHHVFENMFDTVE